MRCRRGSERGVTIVEAAFAMPILFLFIAGLVDIGMWVFNGNQAANAARDGARQGILDFEQADVVGSADYDAIIDVMEAHLPGHTFTSSDVTIECIDPDGNPVSCAVAQLDVDRIRVTTRWHWDLVTPIARAFMGSSRGEVAGTATMALVGRPLPGSGPPPSTTTTTGPSTTTTAPGPTTSTTTSTTTTTLPCTVTDLTISPAQAKNTGSLQNDLVVSFQRNDVPACGTLTVQLQAPQGGSASRACGCGAGPTSFSWTYDKNANSFWTPTNASYPFAYVRVLNGSSVVAQLAFTVS